jgi:hypothetical protein
MKTRVAAALFALLLLLITAVVIWPSKAQAAGRCTSGGAAMRPIALFPGSFILKNTKTSGYVGTPFSFKLKMARGGFPFSSVDYKWYTYDAGYRRSMETGILAPGAAVEVQTWCGGIPGVSVWEGRVDSK